jgi:two-component system, chemotaxis family, protein-glutamate methylesterase/glutaminase
MSATRQRIVPFDVVVIVASAGGLAAIREVLAWLPSSFPASVVVVQHRSPFPDYYAELLGRRCRLPVDRLEVGQAPLPGRVHVVPARGQTVFDDAGRFMVIGDGSGRGDALFASAAGRFGDRAIGVVLTGSGDDGSVGVRAINAASGRVLVQDGDAYARSMPQSAAATGCVDFVLPLRVIGPALTALVLAPGGAELFRVRHSAWANPPLVG